MTTYTWPKSYLLQIYDEAIKQGFLLIENLDAEQAASLRASLNRIRRRSDKANSTYLTPEHYLVTVGQFDPVKGTMPVVFNKIPEGMNLPTFRTATEDEVSAYQERQISTLPETSTLDSGAIDDYVNNMLNASKEHGK